MIYMARYFWLPLWGHPGAGVVFGLVLGLS